MSDWLINEHKKVCEVVDKEEEENENERTQIQALPYLIDREWVS